SRAAQVRVPVSAPVSVPVLGPVPAPAQAPPARPPNDDSIALTQAGDRLMALDILVVDDEQDIRDLVAGVLSDEGYECRTAGDSTTALRLIDELRPSLVLLDVWLHGSAMDGLEVLD